MATKFYLHRGNSGVAGTLPTTEQSSLTSVNDFEANQATNRAMDTTISVSAQTSLANASQADTSTNNYYIARWVSPLLYQTNVTAQTWSFEYAASESNAAANFPVTTSAVGRINAYVWKPSNGTKVGTILDGSTGTIAEAGTTQTVISGTFTGAAVTGMTPGDAVIIVEHWAITTQGNGTSRTQTVFFDGTTENSTSNEAAFVSTPEDLLFSAQATNITVMGGGSSGTASTANTTQYLAVVGNVSSFTTTEGNVKLTMRQAGTLSNFQTRINANGITGNTVLTLMKNGIAGNQSVTFATGVTGLKEDITHTDSIAAGDTIDIKSVPGGATGTITVMSVGVYFTATDAQNTVQILGTASSGENVTANSADRFFVVNGNTTANNATEADAKTRQRVAGTYQYFMVNVTANARTSSTTFKTRKNGADGNISVTYSSTETGVKEDTTHTDSVVSGDDYCLCVTTGAGSGETITFTITKIEFTTTQFKGYISSGTGAGRTYNANITNYPVPSAALSGPATEADGKRRIRHTLATLNDAFVYVSANTVSADSTLKTRINGVNGNISITITASTTGWFSDTTHTDTIGSGDDFGWQLVTGATGTSMVIVDMVVYVRTAQAAAFSRSISDTSISVSDSLIAAQVLSRSISDTSISVSETLARTYNANRSLSDSSISVSDAIARVIGFPKAINEPSISVSDQLDRQEAFSRSISDTSISVSDSLTRSGAFSRAINEASISVSDAIDRVIGFPRDIAETAISVADSVVRALTNSRDINEVSISVSDSAARVYNANRSLSESSISVSDSTTRAVTNSRAINETAIDVTDDIDAVVESVGNFSRDLDETVNVSDQLDREVTNSRAISEPSITVSDDIQIRLDVNRSLSDIVNVSDTLTRTLGFFRSLADIITESDSVERLLAFFRTQNEPAINSSDSIDRSVTNSRDINESVSVSDQLTRIYSTAKNIIEASIPVADSIDISQTFGIPTLTKKIKNWLFSKYEEDDPAKE